MGKPQERQPSLPENNLQIPLLYFATSENLRLPLCTILGLLGMPSSIVYQYLWRDHSLPPHRAWILTLSDNEAIVFIAFVTVAITYTQARTWHIVRSIVNYFTTRIELEVDAVHKLRVSMSQGEAIRRLVQYLRQKRGNGTNSIDPISPFMGVAAIGNGIVFVILGILIPYTLTGGLETPVVRSRSTDSCTSYDKAYEMKEKNAQMADLRFTQCWHNQQTSSCGSMNGIFNDRPALSVERGACIFPEEACLKSPEAVTGYAVRLQHSNISARQLGVNSKSPVVMNHRLTCSPLNTEYFLKVLDNGSVIAFYNESMMPDELIFYAYSQTLYTSNGPNRYSNESSGRVAAFKNQPYALNIWPAIRFERSEASQIHRSLYVPDGISFVVGYRAGMKYYDSPIDDPIFSAHDVYSDTPSYLPDREITALGCIEQFQFCIPQDLFRCTDWGGEDDNYETILLEIYRMNVGWSAWKDFIYFQLRYTIMSTVQSYLLARQTTQVLLSSRSRTGEAGNTIPNIVTKEQWIEELKAWFETSFLQARYINFNLVSGNHPSSKLRHPSGATDFPEDACKKILFLDGSYTNIDFIQLIVLMSAFLLLCLISFRGGLSNAAKKTAGQCRKYGRYFGSYIWRKLKWMAGWFISKFEKQRWTRHDQFRRLGSSVFWVDSNQRRLPVELVELVQSHEVPGDFPRALVR